MSLLKSILLSLCFIGMVGLNAQTLKFNSDKKFKIVQFTDVHWKSGKAESKVSEKCMIKVLDEEKPDLVVFSGDFIKKYNGSLIDTTEGISGISNYILTVKSSTDGKDAAVLYIFDSNSYSKKEETKGYDWIKTDQINWYISESKNFTKENAGNPLPALAFFHIPLPEYNEAASDENAKLIGTRREKACSPVINTGLFAAMLNCGDVMGTFVGHDHVNDYAVCWKGIMLCYGRFTGSKNTYYDIPGGNGARVIELTEGERGFKSWIRLHDGKVINGIAYPEDFKKKE